MRTPILRACSIALLASAALAQPVEQEVWRNGKRLPNDKELRANYCLAVVASFLRADLDFLKTAQSWPTPNTATEQGALLAKGMADTAQHANQLRSTMLRLESYISPRKPYLETGALLSAYDQGRVDFAQHIGNSAREACWNKCAADHRGDESKGRACFAECDAADPLTNRVLSCLRDGSLPY